MLPETLRVKISSEAAEYVSLTPVVARDMQVRELVELMLAVAGKDAARIVQLLKRGSLVSGASRIRWEGVEATEEQVQALIRDFPDAAPLTPFSAERATAAVLKGAGVRIEITREAGSAKRLLHRRTFWDLLIEMARAGQPRYLGYSYKDRADRFGIAVDAAGAERLRADAGLLRYSGLEAQVRRAAVSEIEWIVSR